MYPQMTSQPMTPMQAQPMPTPMMAVPGSGSRNAHNLARDSRNEREWSNGICGCCDDGQTFCLAWVCPSMVYARNKTRLSHLRTQGLPHPTGGETCGSDCFMYHFFGIGWVFQLRERERVRRRYGIAGSGCGDYCTVCWCNPCALAQESLEIRLEERSMTSKA